MHTVDIPTRCAVLAQMWLEDGHTACAAAKHIKCFMQAAAVTAVHSLAVLCMPV